MQVDLTTFLFELVNFVLLTWILGRFVYRPVAASIAARRAELADLRETTRARLAEVEAEQAELRTRQAAVTALRDSVFAEATTEAAAVRARMLAQARDDAAAERERAQAMLEREREAALGWVREVAIEQGIRVAGQVMLKLVPQATHEALVHRLGEELARRGEVLRAAPVDEVSLTVARMPPPDELEELREALGEALGRRPRLKVEEDESLGAGAVLRVGDRVLDASVRGQLEVLRDDTRRLLQAEG